MDLIDAVAGNIGARSVVELSLSALFRRGHGSVMAAIAAFFRRGSGEASARERAAREATLCRPVAWLVPEPEAGQPWLLAVDALPVSRPYAPTLSDRGYVHQAQAVPGQKPVTVGHAYSLATVLPARGTGEPIWAVPISARRIESQVTPQSVAAEQIGELATDKTMPWHDKLVVTVADSGYSQATFLAPVAAHANLVAVSRLRKNRVLYRRPKPRTPGTIGRPRKYGDRLLPGTATSLSSTDQTLCTTGTVGHKAVRIRLYRWNDLLLKGQHQGRLVVTQGDVVCATLTDHDGHYLYNHDLLLCIVGDRRAEVDTAQAYHAYRRRFDQEHAHRFLRRDLLFDAYQTPVTAHEENWITLSTLAYQMLFVARPLAEYLPRPWEPKVPVADGHPPILGPGRVQRDLPRVLRQLGTPAKSPKPRGKSPGWPKGTPKTSRDHHPVVKRGPPKPGPVRKVA